MKSFKLLIISLGFVFLLNPFIAVASSYVWTQTNANQGTVITASSDGTIIVAINGTDTINRSINSGVTWTPITVLGASTWSTITSSSDGTNLVAAGWSTHIWTSGDSGATWTEQLASPSLGWISVSSSADGTHLLGAAWCAAPYYSNDSGVNWSPSNVGACGLGASMSADGQKMAVSSYYGGAVISADYGATWSLSAPAGGSGYLFTAYSGDGSKLYLSAGSGIYVSDDDGSNWTQTAPAAYWINIAANYDGTKAVTVVHTSGDIWTSSDSGQTWIDNASAGTRNWNNAVISNDGLKIAAVANTQEFYTAIFDNTGPTITEDFAILSGTDTTPDYTFTTDEAGDITYG